MPDETPANTAVEWDTTPAIAYRCAKCGHVEIFKVGVVLSWQTIFHEPCDTVMGQYATGGYTFLQALVGKGAGID